MQTVKAKFAVNEVTNYMGGQKVSMLPVQNTQYGIDGENEDNQFARHTPSGEIRLQITNPALKDTFVPGKVFYVDMTSVE